MNLHFCQSCYCIATDSGETILSPLRTSKACIVQRSSTGTYMGGCRWLRLDEAKHKHRLFFTKAGVDYTATLRQQRAVYLETSDHDNCVDPA